ncbi:MAG: preprotein translocase subunit SecB [Vicingaceae bacterium]|jgi:preprotein translocase subunit SecB
MKHKVFSEELIVHYQIVKNVDYNSISGTKLDLSKCDINLDIFKHKTNNKDFRVLLMLFLENFSITVEGHYEVIKNNKSKKNQTPVEFDLLNTLISFLRYSILNITSMTSHGAIHLPPIDLQNLIQHKIDNDSKSEKTTKQKKLK